MNEADRDRRWRDHLLELLAGRSAHLDFAAAVAALPYEHAGVRPEGCEHSIWQLVEHLRIAAADIVDFSRGADYQALAWPDDYWPADARPADGEAWQAALLAYRRQVAAMCELVSDPGNDLLTPFPWGDGQTLAREAMLLADHAAYHLGQIVEVRRRLGAWPASG